MAAPTFTARTAPTVAPVQFGFKIHITLAGDAGIDLWEISTTPIGVQSAGDRIGITTQHNSTYRTFRGPRLKEFTPGSFTCAYAIEDLDQILTQIGNEQVITITWPGASAKYWAFWGYLSSFVPNEATELEMPTAACGLEVIAVDPSEPETEQKAVYATGP